MDEMDIIKIKNFSFFQSAYEENKKDKLLTRRIYLQT